MESAFGVLPTPVNENKSRPEVRTSRTVQVFGEPTAPPYGRRKGWVPRNQTDFGDGGAFPEILLVQYPLGMGQKTTISNALAKQVDAEGKVKYDVLVRQGQNKDKIVYSKFVDLVPKSVEVDDPDLRKPNEEEVREHTEKTKAALEKLVQGKMAAAMPVRAAEKKAPASHVRFISVQQGAGYNSGAVQRTLYMNEVQKDPMEPPRFRINKKIPKGPPSPPAPVLHSPTRKVTVKEQQEWKIPPCISNWKNAKGYTVPLDKRLAADGRGLQQVHINENFAKLAEALYIADRKAREAVEARAQMEKKSLQKEKEAKEETLRVLAQKAREERAGVRAEEKDEDLVARDELRRERGKERQRERNLARAPDKRNRVVKDRDVSEKIALGLPNPGGRDEQFDQRLFNQSRGMDSGFAGGEDETYNVYDRPWRQTNDIASSIYRPSKNVDDIYGNDLDKIMKANRFVPDKEFAGTDRTVRREGPVEFAKDEEEDPFGLDKFLVSAKRGQKRPAEEPTHGREHDRIKKRR